MPAFLSPDGDNCSQKVFLFPGGSIKVKPLRSLLHGLEHHRAVSDGVLYPKGAEETGPDTASRREQH